MDTTTNPWESQNVWGLLALIIRIPQRSVRSWCRIAVPLQPDKILVLAGATQNDDFTERSGAVVVTV